MSEIIENEVQNLETQEETQNHPKRDKAEKEAMIKWLKSFDIDNLSTKDIKNNPISKSDIRSTVDSYYQMQDMRIIAGNRKSAILNFADEQSSPLLLQYIETRFKNTEENIAKFLKYYAENDPIGQWMMSITGIGPVIAAGLLAYIDINECETAGSIWSYAGWEGPMRRKMKGEKVDWNPKFRTLCWKIGQSFIKISGNTSPNNFYGPLYVAKKEFYIQKNEAGGFAEKAAFELENRKFKPSTKSYQAYIQGKLPDSQIVAMAARFAAKMFLSHLFEIWYEYDRGEKPPKPFVEAHLDHVHILPAPNREIVFGNRA